jgi:hypothetical protein
MNLTQKIFYGLTALSLLVAAAAQFFLFVELDSQCNADITTAPGTAGACLVGSFVFTGMWLAGKSYNKPSLKKAGLLIWTMMILAGVVASGATLGQIYLYDDACGAGAVTSNINILSLQYASIALLILSIAVPHISKPKNTKGAGDASLPLTNNENQKRPLVFL